MSNTHWDEIIKERNGRWIRKNGQEILIKDMDSYHIRNSINMLKRVSYSPLHSAKIKELKAELDKRDIIRKEFLTEEFQLRGAL
jgi:hypothetical protein